MCNFYISALSPVMRNIGVTFLSNVFTQNIQDGYLKPDVTWHWISSPILNDRIKNEFVTDFNDCALDSLLIDLTQLTDIIRTNGIESLNNVNSQVELLSNVTLLFVARGIVDLMRSTQRLDSVQGLHILPETLCWDAQRLAKLRDDVDVLCLQACILIVVRQLLVPVGIQLVEADEMELFHRLDFLLRDPTTFHTHLLNEVVRFVRTKYERETLLASTSVS